MPVEILRLSLVELCERLELDPARFTGIRCEWVPSQSSSGVRWRRDILIFQEPKDADERQHTGPLPGR